MVGVDGASVEGLGVDETLAAVRRAADGRSMLTLTLKRLVPRASITLRVLSPEGAQVGEEIETLAGGNLRMELLRKQIELYDARTKRFDNPWGTGDCAGEGLCGTCLVELKDGGVRCSHLCGESPPRGTRSGSSRRISAHRGSSRLISAASSPSAT